MAKKIKISKSEVVQIIKEEYAKKKQEVKLKTRLQEVEAKIKTLIEGFSMEDEETIEEVEASGTRKINSGSPDGLSDGDGFGKKFQVKGTHKLEEDEELEIPGEDVEEIEVEIPGDEDVEMGFEDDIEATDDIEALLAKLADAIEEKVEDVVDKKLGGEAEEGGEGIEIDAPGDEEGMEVNPEEIEELQENAEEPQDGHSPATEQSSDGPGEKTPFTEKQDTINESQLISEEAKSRSQVLAGIKKGDIF